MDPAIATGLLSLAGTAIGTICGLAINTKLSNYRIEQLEKKVEKHNNLVERTYSVEKAVGELGQKVEFMQEEINELKK